ncbi:hypothetical protein GS506_10835 [Rhodococcus hoagii]|nr:hypothetical protein [Prescottella equi]
MRSLIAVPLSIDRATSLVSPLPSAGLCRRSLGRSSPPKGESASGPPIACAVRSAAAGIAATLTLIHEFS